MKYSKNSDPPFPQNIVGSTRGVHVIPSIISTFRGWEREEFFVRLGERAGVLAILGA